MDTLTTIFCILIIIMAVFLTIAVLMQSGKSRNLSGAIAGGAETFFGKTKGKTIDKILSKATTVVAIIFVILVLVVYVIQTSTANNAAPKATNPTTSTAAVENQTATEEEFVTTEPETSEPVTAGN